MKTYIKKTLGFLFIVIALSGMSLGARLVVYADDPVETPADDDVVETPADDDVVETPAQGTTLPVVKLDNPYNPSSGINNLCDLINVILNIIAEIGAIIGVLFILWSGFLFIKAQGNPEKIKQAKATFLTTILGIAILLGATVITKIIFNTVSSVTSTFNSGATICSSSSTP